MRAVKESEGIRLALFSRVSIKTCKKKKNVLKLVSVRFRTGIICVAQSISKGNE